MIYTLYPNYSPQAKSFRDFFDKQMQNPHFTHQNRFVWDFWHVPNEYHFLRTPAFQYFPKKLYEKWHRDLVLFGRENFGCHDISPTWLSNYINGCKQEAHRDEPHGPLAFVWSLTPNNKKFKGGDTIIWDDSKKKKQIAKIPPKFNQLLVFDPSYLHGVSQVQNVEDPRYGRLVQHGWFVQPRPFWYGPLTINQIEKGLDQIVAQTLPKGRTPRGFVSLKLHIKPSGELKQTELLVETLKLPEKLKQQWLGEWASNIQNVNWSKNKKGTVLTVPFVFS